ncbi:MAG: S-layer homology domain-containing protein [Oscillospiraceae bacterium]|jgi:hypothetical protein|nr:S-layer homology domain-containing protein [Oscillospiraceae bacterium]
MTITAISVALLFTVRASDQLVPLSYLEQTYVPSIRSALQGQIDTRLNEFRAKYGIAETGLVSEYSLAVAAKTLALTRGDTLELQPMATAVFASGDANTEVSGGELIDLTNGVSIAEAAVLSPAHRYIAAEGTAAIIRVYSDGAEIIVQGSYKVERGDTIPAERTFIDVPASHWANAYIISLSERGIVNGMGNFRFAPSNELTRAEFVTMLSRVAGVDPSRYNYRSMSDVTAEDWFCPYVTWAAESGVVTGYEDNTFRPNELITREQIALLLLRLSEQYEIEDLYSGSSDYSAYDTSEEDGTESDSIFEDEYSGSSDPSVIISGSAAEFADAGEVSDWASEGVSWAAEQGLITGYEDGTFAPKKSATRAEVCAILSRLSER